MKNNMGVKKLFGLGIKITIGAIVAAFLGMHSLNFFQYTFPADQVFFAFLGFGLTGGAAIAYLILFVVDADTSLKLVISLSVMVVSIIGELATAFYGMQVETWAKAGFVLTETDYQNMLWVVMILGFVHGIALVMYFAGDKVIWMFGDADNDGKMDGFDDKDNRTGKPFQRRQMVSMAQNTERPEENPTRGS